ncbi:hypothetical protein JW911_03870 [Candidatus Peregrinibacteria bacterium]|nr:hypothetical protein [Candidatus Peregrinibacteria bacterium]
MHQLGAAFVNSWLIPETKKILKNVEKDDHLMKLFKTQEPMKAEWIDALEKRYFQNAQNDFQYNFKYRKIFFRELIEFVGMQKKICGEKLWLLALRMLPVVNKKEGPQVARFEKAAEENIAKFAFRVVKAIEEDHIRDLIEKKKMNKEISPEKAAKDLKDLKEGKLLLIRGRKKGAEFDYANIEEIKKLVEQGKEFDEFFTEESEEGRKMFGFTSFVVPKNEMKPDEVIKTDFGDTYKGIEAQSYASRTVKLEKTLEDSGLYVEASFKTDAGGIAKGKIQDKNGEKWDVEVDLNRPTVIFKFYLSSNRAKNFQQTPEELNRNFKIKKLKVAEAYRIKQEGARIIPFALYKAPATVPAQPAAGAAAAAASVPRPLGEITYPKTVMGPSFEQTRQAKQTAQRKETGEEIKTGYAQQPKKYQVPSRGAMTAKAKRAARKGAAVSGTMPLQPTPAPVAAEPETAANVPKKKRKNPIFRVLKWTTGTAGVVAGSGIGYSIWEMLNIT